LAAERAGADGKSPQQPNRLSFVWMEGIPPMPLAPAFPSLKPRSSDLRPPTLRRAPKCHEVRAADCQAEEPYNRLHISIIYNHLQLRCGIRRLPSPRLGAIDSYGP
jgi:hypothetical protein